VRFDIITRDEYKGTRCKKFSTENSMPTGIDSEQASEPERHNQHKTSGLRSNEDQKPVLNKMVHVLKYNILLCPNGHGILVLLTTTTMYVSEWQHQRQRCLRKIFLSFSKLLCTMVQLTTCTKEHVLETQSLGFQVEPGATWLLETIEGLGRTDSERDHRRTT